MDVQGGYPFGGIHVKGMTKSHNIVWLISKRFVAKALKPFSDVPRGIKLPKIVQKISKGDFKIFA